MITDGKVYRPEQAERAFVKLMALLDSNCDRPSPSRCRTWASTTVKSLDGHPLLNTCTAACMVDTGEDVLC